MNTNTINTPTLTVPARKSLRGKWGKAGAPPKAVKYPRGGFTIGMAIALNPHVCPLTIRTNVDKSIAGKTLVKLSDTTETGKVGRPSFRYMTKAAYDATRNAAKNLKVRKVATPVVATTPVLVAPEAVAV